MTWRISTGTMKGGARAPARWTEGSRCWTRTGAGNSGKKLAAGAAGEVEAERIGCYCTGTCWISRRRGRTARDPLGIE